MFIEYLLSAKAALTKKRAAEDEMVRKHHLLNEHEFEQTLGDSEDHCMLRVLWTEKISNSQSQRKSTLTIHWKD